MDGRIVLKYESGQVREIQEWADGIKHGDFLHYLEDGRPLIKNTWVDGAHRRHEEWVYGHPGGGLSTHSVWLTEGGDFQDSSLYPDVQTIETFDDLGRLGLSWEWKGGRQDGRQLWNTEGVLIRDEEWSQGNPHGHSKEFSFENDGALISDQHYAHGRLDGESLKYDPSTGILLTRAQYRRGLRHGLYETFFPEDGLPLFKGEFVDDEPDGLHKWWMRLEDGRVVLASEWTYSEGVLHGIYRGYNGGVLAWSGTYEDGLESGTSRSYSGGELSSLKEYSRGSLHGVSETYSEGELWFRLRYTHGIRDGLDESFSSGELSGSTVYDLGVEIGPRKQYSGGQLRRLSPLVNERVEGIVKTYSDGSLSTESAYVAGIRHGTHRAYGSDGTLGASGRYSNGEQCGTWTWPNGDGTSSSKSYGACTPLDDVPALRKVRGKVTVEGAGKAGVRVEFSDTEYAVTESDGAYFLELEGSGSTYQVKLAHDHYQDRTVEVSISEESGVYNRNFSLEVPPDPNLEVGALSIKGTHFLQGVSLPMQVPVEIDWGDAPRGKVEWVQGSYHEDVHDYLQLDPAYDFEGDKGLGAIVVRAASGNEVERVSLPDIQVHPQPGWSKTLGDWFVSNGSGENAPATYRLNRSWPPKPLNIGISEDTVDAVTWAVWSAFPIVGDGPLGVFNTQLTFDVTARTDGPGEFKLKGNGELHLWKVKSLLQADGTGEVQWRDTLAIENASILLKFRVAISDSYSLNKVFRNLDKLPFGERIKGNLLKSVFGYGLKFEIGGEVADRYPLDTKSGKLGFKPTETQWGFFVKGGLSVSLIGLESSLEGDVLANFRAEGEEMSFEGLDSELRSKIKIQRFGFVVFESEVTYPEPTESESDDDSFPALQFIPRPVEPDFLDASVYAQFGPDRRGDEGRAVAADEAPSSTPRGERLIENIYSYAAPVIAEQDGTKAIGYIHFDPNRPEGQSTRLYVTIDDGSGFAIPGPVHHQARADFNPDLAFLADGRLVAVWETSKLGQTAPTFEERVTGMEIAWSVYTPSTRSWSTPTLLTDNDHLDQDPVLAASASGPMVIWRSNPVSALVADSDSPDAFTSATWSRSGFAAPVKLPFDAAAYGSPGLAFDGQSAVLVWVEDMDDDYATTDDHELFRSRFQNGSWSDREQITSDAVADGSPKLFCLESGTEEMIWTKGKDLVRLINPFTGDFQIIRKETSQAVLTEFDVGCDALGRIAVVWAEFRNLQTDLRFAVYDPGVGEWSHEFLLTDTVNTERKPSFVLGSDNRLVATCVTDQIDSELRDLYVIRQDIGRDVGLGSISATEADHEADQYTLTVAVQNLGPFATSGVEVEYFLGDPDLGGKALGTVTLDLSGGEKVDHSITTSGLAAGSSGKIYVRVDSADRIDELDESNNLMVSPRGLQDIVDDDGDGIADRWEMQHFDDLTYGDETDFDRDGTGDLLEFLADTRPDDAQSGFAATVRPDPVDSSSVLVGFPTVRGRAYMIEGSPDLRTWVDIVQVSGNGFYQEYRISTESPGSGSTDVLIGFRVRVTY